MKKNILVMNGNFKICEEIKGALQDEYSTEVYCASSIEEATEVFVKHRFCLVILDIHLAGSDGLKLLGIMRLSDCRSEVSNIHQKKSKRIFIAPYGIKRTGKRSISPYPLSVATCLPAVKLVCS